MFELIPLNTSNNYALVSKLVEVALSEALDVKHYSEDIDASLAVGVTGNLVPRPNEYSLYTENFNEESRWATLLRDNRGSVNKWSVQPIRARRSQAFCSRNRHRRSLPSYWI